MPGIYKRGDPISRTELNLTLPSSSAQKANTMITSGKSGSFAADWSSGVQDAIASAITSSAEANRLSYQSAMAAMAQSSAEAAKDRAFQQEIYNQTSAYNAQQAQMNRDFEERMSSTAYQRAVADMKAAGLNPMLAYMQGGASTPGGSTATIGTLNGAMGNGYSYMGQQDSSGVLKIAGFVGDLIAGFADGLSSAFKTYTGQNTSSRKQEKAIWAKIKKLLKK